MCIATAERRRSAWRRMEVLSSPRRLAVNSETVSSAASAKGWDCGTEIGQLRIRGGQRFVQIHLDQNFTFTQTLAARAPADGRSSSTPSFARTSISRVRDVRACLMGLSS